MNELSSQSIVSFMLDPKGEIPWNEEADAKDVLHLQNQKVGLTPERRVSLE